MIEYFWNTTKRKKLTVKPAPWRDQLRRGIFLMALRSHFAPYSKIFLAWPDVSGKPLWVGKPVSMLMQEIGGRHE